MIAVTETPNHIKEFHEQLRALLETFMEKMDGRNVEVVGQTELESFKEPTYLYITQGVMNRLIDESACHYLNVVMIHEISHEDGHIHQQHVVQTVMHGRVIRRHHVLADVHACYMLSDRFENLRPPSVTECISHAEIHCVDIIRINNM